MIKQYNLIMHEKALAYPMTPAAAAVSINYNFNFGETNKHRRIE
jgi:hypothetical protein